MNYTPERPTDWQRRSAATGPEAAMLVEARIRLDAASADLAHAAIGHTDPDDVLLASVRLINQAARLVTAAGGGQPSPPPPTEGDGWWAAEPEPCAACGEPTWWRNRNGVPYCEDHR
ncbi:MAG: hypothetical protein J2P57_04390 [Acidimicrobiaceae bacterium]|nr:hypothetical protein [Acidimicrobiaceae bacterium]